MPLSPAGGGAGASKLQISDMTITRPMDTNSIALISSLDTFQSLNNVSVLVLQQPKTGPLAPLFTYDMDIAYLSSLRYAASATGASINEIFTLKPYGQLSIAAYTVDQSGNPVTIVSPLSSFDLLAGLNENSQFKRVPAALT